MPIVNNFPPASSSGIFPGMILMWSGTIDTIPGGWQLCDGTNGTPNLCDRFIVCAGNGYDVGSTGGSDSVTLTTTQMPSHKHSVSVTINSNGEHTHTYYEGRSSGTGYNVSYSNASARSSVNTSSSGSHSHTATVSESSVGSGEAHENRPPYYALAYIMKL